MRRTRIIWTLALTACASGQEPELQQSWQQRAALPEARTEVSVTTDGRLIYLAGGFGEPTGGQVTAPRALHVYDPAANTWSAAGSIPEGVNHAGLVHVNGKLYLIGGFRETGFSPTGAVRIFDITSRTWSDGAPLPTPRGALTTVVLDGRIHAIGGSAVASALDHRDHGIGVDGSSVGTHEVYDPATNTWTRRAPLATPRNHLGAAVANGKIHVVGGRVGSNMTMTTHEVYDPATNTWTSAPALPTGRSGIAVVEHQGSIYVFGGETNGKTFDEAERFNPSTVTWTSLARMPTPRHGLGAASVGNAVYVISGGPQPGFAFSGLNEMIVP